MKIHTNFRSARKSGMVRHHECVYSNNPDLNTSTANLFENYYDML